MADPNLLEDFSSLMRDADSLGIEIVRSERILLEHTKALRENTEKFNTVKRQIIEKLESMDVMQHGNTGWANRTINFLLAYRQHVSNTGE